ncbi:hypothetical protein HG530_002625 [Fusarium avenaceum]|nr:hypothetical protein HG530_002625 [Fusarium avenaceum]
MVAFLLLSTGDLPAVDNKGILARDNVVANNNLPTMHHAPSHRSERLIQSSSVLDFRQIDNTIRLDLHILRINRPRQDLVLFNGNRLRSKAVPALLPADIVRVLDIGLARFAQRALMHGNSLVRIRQARGLAACSRRFRRKRRRFGSRLGRSG